MKTFVYSFFILIAFLFLTAKTSQAQALPIRNDTPTELRDLGSNLNVGRNFAVNKYGQMQCTLVAGDSPAYSPIKLEDTALATGDAGVFVLAVSNESYTAFAAASGDYIPIATNRVGTVNVMADFRTYQDASSTANGLLKREDDPHSSLDAGVAALYITQDPLTVAQGATGDYVIPKTDRAGRTIMTFAPAGESFQSCGTATATTSDVAMKAAVASNRMYVTSITCKNTSATVATSLDFKDGSTVMAVGGISQMATTAAGAFSATFPVPLRGTVNTALNFATNISVSSVTCCAHGYVSVN